MSMLERPGLFSLGKVEICCEHAVVYRIPTDNWYRHWSL